MNYFRLPFFSFFLCLLGIARGSDSTSPFPPDIRDWSPEHFATIREQSQREFLRIQEKHSLEEIETTLLPGLRKRALSPHPETSFHAFSVLQNIRALIVADYPTIDLPPPPPQKSAFSFGHRVWSEKNPELGIEIMLREGATLDYRALSALAILFDKPVTNSDGQPMNRQYDPRILSLFQTLAKENHPQGHLFLAKAYAEGRGLPKDPEKARYHFQKAQTLSELYE